MNMKGSYCIDILNYTYTYSCNVTFGRLTELRIVPEGKETSEPVVVVAFNRLAILPVWPATTVPCTLLTLVQGSLG